MSTEAAGYTQEELHGNAEAVRETVAEWMRHNADRIVSGKYMEDLPDSSVEVKLTRRDVRDLNMLIAAAALASDGEIFGRGYSYTPEPVRRAWKRVLEHADTAVRKIEAAAPCASRDDLYKWRGDALRSLLDGIHNRAETP